MNLLNKLFKKKKEENALYNSYNFYLNREISQLNDMICSLPTYVKTHSEFDNAHLSYQILNLIERIGVSYKAYLKEVVMAKRMYDQHPTERIKETLDMMKEKKKSLRADFERLYKNFQRNVPKTKEIPMNMILKAMRKNFDFDGSLLSSDDYWCVSKNLNK